MTPDDARSAPPGGGPPPLYFNSSRDNLDLDDITEAVAQMLRESPEPGAEEYAIHDYDEFGCIRIGEYTDLATVNRLAIGLAEHGCAFGHWAELVGHDPDDLDRFEDCYRGHWDTLADYARDLLDDLGTMDEIERAVPDWIRPYVTIQWEMLGDDLAAEMLIAEDSSRSGVSVFDPHR